MIYIRASFQYAADFRAHSRHGQEVRNFNSNFYDVLEDNSTIFGTRYEGHLISVTLRTEVVPWVFSANTRA